MTLGKTISWIAFVALISGITACGGSSGGGGGGSSAATAGSLANRSFVFGADQGLFDPGEPLFGQDVIFTVGSFNGNTAAMTLTGATDGSLVGGTITLGSCTLRFDFEEASGVTTPIEAGEGDNVAVLDPCTVGADGSLTITDFETGEVFVSQPAAPPRLLLDLTVPMSAEFQVPASLADVAALGARGETGTATFQVWEGNILSYTLNVNNLAAADALTISHIHQGDSAENGNIFITLAGGPPQPSGIRPADTIPQFDGGTSVTSSVALSGAEVAALTDAANDHYVNVHSGDLPAGLVRGQLGETIVLAANVALDAANEVPPLTSRTETGLAVLRVEDGAAPALKFALEVFDLDVTDALQISHIHDGASTVNGNIFITLVGGPAQPPLRPAEALATFDGASAVHGQVAVSADEVAALIDATRPFYVNIHSTQQGGGLVRGQVRDLELTSLETDVQPILTQNCAFAGCHGEPTLQANLNLTAGLAFDNLVDVPAQFTDPGDNVRVVPGNSASSVLWQRISGEGLDPAEVRMPQGFNPLSAVDQATIQNWIDQGAADN